MIHLCLSRKPLCQNFGMGRRDPNANFAKRLGGTHANLQIAGQPFPGDQKQAISLVAAE